MPDRDGTTTTIDEGYDNRESVRDEAPNRGRVDGDYDASEEGYLDEYTARDGNGGGWGLPALLLAAGVILFLFPEPITSTVGILLVVAGVAVWLYEWAT